MPERNYPTIGDEPGQVARLWREDRWHAQDDFWRPYLRTVEQNVRMVAGRHWDIWVDLVGRFVDITRYMSERERLWRQRPVFNWIGYWYQVTMAKMTENPPIITFLPATPDRRDALLAEFMDPVFKYLWHALSMPLKHDMLMRWVVCAGRGVLKSTWDPRAGEPEPMVGPAILDLGQGPTLVDGLPYGLARDEEGNPTAKPLVEVLPDGSYRVTGEPTIAPRGQLSIDVLSPLEVRSSPEPVPEHEKRWWVHRGALHVDEVKSAWGIEIEPDLGHEDDALNRLMFGLGHVGSATDPRTTSDWQKRSEGFVTVYECWERPRYDVPDLERGRHTIVVGESANHVVVDEPVAEGPDYVPFAFVDFIGLPGRPVGKSPVEDMTPIQLAYNRGWGQLLEHRNLLTNPIVVIVGNHDVEFTNEPGRTYHISPTLPGIEPVKFYTPPPIGADVYRIQQMLLATLQDLGSLRSGSEGRPPTRDPSGELVKELRFNDDRYVGPALIRTGYEYARHVQEAWIPLLRTYWTEDRMVRVAGEDQAARFLLVKPAIFQGRVHARPVPESMLPEGRGEREQRIERWYLSGVFGQPGTPEAQKAFLELVRYPHLGRATRPGGVDRSTAEWENAQLAMGQQVMPIEPHDDLIHLAVHREFMATPDYRRLPAAVQSNFELHTRAHEVAQQVKALRQFALAAQVQDAIAGGAPAGNGQREGAPQRPKPEPSKR